MALTKLSNVIGKADAEAVYAETLQALALESLRSADDLLRFAQHVRERAGFVGAVGALLSVHAVMHGAKSKSKGVQGA